MKKSLLLTRKPPNTIRQNIVDYIQGKKSREFIKEFLVLTLLALIFGVLISPYFFFYKSEYKVGTIAAEDIKSDRDFLVEEKLTTEAKRAAVLRITPLVFDYRVDLSISLQSQIIQLFAMITDEMQRASVTPQTNETIESTAIHPDFEVARKYLNSAFNINLPDEELSAFYRHGFSAKTARNVSRLIDNIFFNAYITNHPLTKVDMERGIIILNTKSGEEMLITDMKNVTDLQVARAHVARKADLIFPDMDTDLKLAIVSLVRKIISPNLSLNTDVTKAKKETALNTVKPTYFRILKNEMIVREGEKITPAILDKLEAHEAIKGGKKRFGDMTSLLGITLIIMLVSVAFFSPIKKWNPKRVHLKNTFIFLVTLVLLQFILIRFGLIISDAVARAFPILTPQDCFFAIPFVMGSMLVTVLINDRIAILYSVFISLMLGFLFDNRIFMSIYALSGSLFAVYQIYYSRQRSSFYVSGLLLGLINSIVILAFSLFSEVSLGLTFFMKLLMGIIGGIASGVIAAGLIPLFEGLFKFTTDIKLLELGNLNQPIFQRMIIETPGTYHHSIIVASLAESAAEAIGAHALLAKVSAYYHDIGKMVKPHYFIENQDPGENKHEKLTPKMSSLVIISHVKDGCEFAEQLKLGDPITDIIRQHHGTSLVSFFYDKAKKAPDSHINTLSDTDFRYPGPKPQSKEAALVMLSDVIEATSRTLDDPTPARLSNLVHERIERIFLDGQLDECELTLRDLNKIADSFIRILTGIFHQRITYPE
jgi:putative nucleotidyltransferase with HDIG domain